MQDSIVDMRRILDPTGELEEVNPQNTKSINKHYGQDSHD